MIRELIYMVVVIALLFFTFDWVMDKFVESFDKEIGGRYEERIKRVEALSECRSLFTIEECSRRENEGLL